MFFLKFGYELLYDMKQKQIYKYSKNELNLVNSILNFYIFIENISNILNNSIFLKCIIVQRYII